MSSFVRNMQRKVLRQGKTTTDDDGNTVTIKHEPRPQHLTMLPGGGYIVVRYTKGPLRVSPRRVFAQVQMGAQLDHVPASFGSTSKPRRDYHKPMAAVPGTVTRQQIRYARRKGLPIPGAPVEKPKRVRKSRAKSAAA